jgi:hypothetical protein
MYRTEVRGKHEGVVGFQFLCDLSTVLTEISNKLVEIASALPRGRLSSEDLIHDTDGISIISVDAIESTR